MNRNLIFAVLLITGMFSIANATCTTISGTGLNLTLQPDQCYYIQNMSDSYMTGTWKNLNIIENLTYDEQWYNSLLNIRINAPSIQDINEIYTLAPGECKVYEDINLTVCASQEYNTTINLTCPACPNVTCGSIPDCPGMCTQTWDKYIVCVNDKVLLNDKFFNESQSKNTYMLKWQTCTQELNNCNTLYTRTDEDVLAMTVVGFGCGMVLMWFIMNNILNKKPPRAKPENRIPDTAEVIEIKTKIDKPNIEIGE